ncbi:MAG: sulfatase-like hydrolase/transferase [Myxococcota bacterium]
MIWLAGCAPAPLCPDAGGAGPNLVVVVLDDVGLDKIGRYGVHPVTAPTPTFDQLASEGLLYRDAYALPSCTATRAALLNGRHARRTGTGSILWPFDGSAELPLDEVTIPELLRPAGYCSAIAGKWHLSTLLSPSGARHPWGQGFAWYSGSLNNLWVDTARRSGGNGYYAFEKVGMDGEIALEERYATTDTTDDAIALVHTLPSPFFLMVSYNAAHNPWHDPPAALQGYGTGLDPFTSQLAMLEAADAELARLVDVLPDDTVLVLLSDNGSSSSVAQPPSDPERAKNTVYEGGIRVPMVVTGPGVPAGVETHALFSVVDLLPTFAELAGAALPDVPLDGVSALPTWRDPAVEVRGSVYAEELSPAGPGPWVVDERSLRDDRYKLVRHTDGAVELFDLLGRTFDEGEDLLLSPTPEAEAALDRLTAALDATVDDLTR